MTLSSKAQSIYNQISAESTKHGDLRKIAKEIKKDHTLAMELWSTEHYFSMQLAILIMDKALLTQDVINMLDESIQKHDYAERTHLNRLVNGESTYQT